MHLPDIKFHGTDGRCASLVDNYGATQCDEEGEYERINQCFIGGVVKSRVTRFDEDRDASVSFPNNIPIWKFRFLHPAQNPPGNLAAMLDALDTTCGNMIAMEAPGAFIINEEADDPACWQRVNELLELGISSTTCAEYYADPPAQSAPNIHGIHLEFDECRGEF